MADRTKRRLGVCRRHKAVRLNVVDLVCDESTGKPFHFLSHSTPPSPPPSGGITESARSTTHVSVAAVRLLFCHVLGDGGQAAAGAFHDALQRGRQHLVAGVDLVAAGLFHAVLNVAQKHLFHHLGCHAGVEIDEQLGAVKAAQTHVELILELRQTIHQLGRCGVPCIQEDAAGMDKGEMAEQRGERERDLLLSVLVSTYRKSAGAGFFSVSVCSTDLNTSCGMQSTRIGCREASVS